MQEKGFLIFYFFCYFFRNFLALVEYERNSGLKFFSRFLTQSHPVLAKNNAGKRALNFLNFFSIFFQNFHAWVKFEPNSGLKFLFFLFLGQSHPVLAKNNARKWFFNFCFFLIFCSEFFCPGRV